jgi:hypothetical protein
LNASASPTLLLLDDDTDTLSELSGLMERRYGRDYRVVADTSAATALRKLVELREAGDPGPARISFPLDGDSGSSERPSLCRHFMPCKMGDPPVT